MRINDAKVQDIRGLWGNIEQGLGSCEHLEDAAQLFCASVHEAFSDSIKLARIFVTVPYAELPEANQRFVDKLLESAGSPGAATADTPVLSLLGTHGTESGWNDRRSSQGHVGIPLLSSAFIGEIPMIARLLKELGVPIEWVDNRDSEIVSKALGSSAGLFYVDDAATAVDNQDRKIIAAQDFVVDHDIKSVFGVGGAYFGGRICSMIFFCGDSVEKAAARRFMPLTNFFKSKTGRLNTPEKVFNEAS
jgi:hypothetical protein